MINRLFTALASTSEEPSLIEELWEYFSKKYLTPNYGSYENIDISSDPVVSTAMVILAGFIAVMAGACVMIFTKRTLGRLVRRLLKNEALSAESAKTFDELGLSKSRALRLFINKTTLSKAVRCREEDEAYGIGKLEGKDDAYKEYLRTPSKLRYKRDPEKDHFYIPEEQKYRADVRFEKKGIGWLTVLLTAVCAVVAASLLCTFLPDIVRLMDNLILFFTQ